MADRSHLPQLSGDPLGNLDSNPQQGRRFLYFVLISLVLHLALLAGSIFFQGMEFAKPQPKVVRVDLVSFSPAASRADSAPAVNASAPETLPDPGAVSVSQPKSAPQPAPEPVANIKPDISLKGKPKNLKKMMAKAAKAPSKPKRPSKKLKPKSKVDTEKMLEKARRELERKVEAENQKQLSQALDRLKDKVASRKEPVEGASNSGGNGSGGRPGRPGGPMDLYKTIIQSAIEQNWVFNETLARLNQNLETRILIKILKSGEIRDIIFETRSGNQYLDESAKKAIQRANPLPGLPLGLSSYELVIIFTPKGLR
ncbi:MAG: TonB family protein [Desulfobacterales bacterium]|nr:TonB family protein [Desulfobacterales bacterium]